MKFTIYPIPSVAPLRLAIVARPRGGDWLCDELSGLRSEGVDVLVSMLTMPEAEELLLQRESEECRAAGIEFVSISIPDRSVPPNKGSFLQDVDSIIDLLRKGHFVGVHCRASIGCSSVLAVSVLIRLGMDGAEAFRIVEAARLRPIPDTEEQKRWVLENIVRG
ncbi:MAG TPA: hypothetical protein VF135_00905 [Terriglobales bacterium]